MKKKSKADVAKMVDAQSKGGKLKAKTQKSKAADTRISKEMQKGIIAN